MAEHVLGTSGRSGGALRPVADPGEGVEPRLDVAGLERGGDPGARLGEGVASGFELARQRHLGIALGRAQLGCQRSQGGATALDRGPQLRLAPGDRLGSRTEALVRRPQRRQLPPHGRALAIPLGKPLLDLTAALVRLGQLRLDPVAGLAGRSGRRLRRRQVAAAGREPIAEQPELQLQRLALEPCMGLGRIGLLAQRPQTRASLAFDVERPVEVRAGPLELQLSAAATLAVLAEARRLLDQHAPLARLREHDRLDLPLSDHRVHLTPEAGVGERFGDVGEAAASAVEPVAPVAGAVEPAGHRDLRELGAGGAVGVVDHHLDLGGAAGGAIATAREDHILHRLAADRQGTLLAERPEDAVGDVGLPAAVGPDDHADAR